MIKSIDPQMYAVTVDYGQSFKQMKDAGHYEVYDDDNLCVVPEGYAIEGQGLELVVISLLVFEPFISSEEVVREMRDNHYRPANIAELLALGARHPDLQMKGGDIVELGTIDYRINDDPWVAFIGEEDGKKKLWHDCWDQEWDDSVRFAAVPI